MSQFNLKETIGVVANVGVVVGIFFLVFELDQNTNALYAESRQSTLFAAQAELFEMLDRPELYLTVLQAEPLSELEQLRLSAWLNALMRAREFSWLQYQDGIMDEAQWSTERTIMVWILSAPRTREWCRRFTPIWRRV